MAEGTQAEPVAAGGIREVGVDDAAIQLAYAQSVIVVPGYGLAVAQGSTRFASSATFSRRAA